MRTSSIAWALAVAGLAACTGAGAPTEVHGTLERDRLELVAESHERIVEIAVREGDRVATGAVLVRQEAGAMQPRLDQARASVATAERRLADLVAGARAREVDDARATLSGAESALAVERSEYTRVATLVERQLLSASDLDRARGRRDAALATRDQARARLRLLEEGSRPEQVRGAEAEVERARAALEELETSAAQYVVRAPRAGTIEALPYESGERPPAGAPVVVMLADGSPHARVHVPEPLRVRFTPGRVVEATIDGVEGALRGTVRYVSAEATFTPYYSLTQRDRSRLSYLAEIELDDPRAVSLPAGIPVQVRVPEPEATP